MATILTITSIVGFRGRYTAWLTIGNGPRQKIGEYRSKSAARAAVRRRMADNQRKREQQGVA